jgi:hypothetical protein
MLLSRWIMNKLAARSGVRAAGNISFSDFVRKSPEVAAMSGALGATSGQYAAGAGSGVFNNLIDQNTERPAIAMPPSVSPLQDQAQPRAPAQSPYVPLQRAPLRKHLHINPQGESLFE